jgi:hypothetical protein
MSVSHESLTKEEALALPIGDLNLSARARKVRKLGIVTVGDLVRRTADDLLEINYFGKGSLNEIRNKLDEYGLWLRGDRIEDCVAGPTCPWPQSRAFDDFVFKKPDHRIKKEEAFRKDTDNNRKITVLTAEQVMKWWEASEEDVKKIPVAAFFDGEPYYTEYQVDTALGSPHEGAIAYAILDRPASDFSHPVENRS